MCFTLPWFEALLVWLVIVCAIVAILRLLVPLVTAQLGIPLVGQIINIVLWAVIVIFVIYFAFAMISCLSGMGGGFPSLMPHPR